MIGAFTCISKSFDNSEILKLPGAAYLPEPFEEVNRMIWL